MRGEGLVDRTRLEIKLGDYAVAPAAALADPALLPRVQDYRRQLGSRMLPLDRDDIRRKIPAADYFVSRKIDGEFAVLVFRDGEALSVNPGGTVRMGLPWQAEAAGLLKQAGVREAMIAGELYVARAEGRPRVHDVVSVARQPSEAADLQRLRFAAFDVMSLDGNPCDSYAEARKQIERMLGKGETVHPVEVQQAGDSDGVERLFREWVDQQGAEGLVVWSDTVGLFKIKPRHTLDVAVIGFTESGDERQGMLHDLLVAVMRADGTLHVLTRVGGGFSEAQRRTMLSDLKDIVVQSEYAEVNSEHVAYQMVEPSWVIEISCLDLLSQTTSGGPINRMVLDWDEISRTYRVVRRLPLASVISPQFIRLREDKRVAFDDIRIGQLADIVEVPWVDRDARRMSLPSSDILRREVYTKQLKGETLVRKFLLWKTNKETESDDYPAYVIHYTDYSPNRKSPLDREIRVSNSREQIEALWSGIKEANVTRGWNPYSTSAAESPAAALAVADTPAPEEVEALATTPPKKKAARKTAASADKEAAPPMAPSERTKKPARKKKSG